MPGDKPRVSARIEQEILRRIHSGELPVGSRLPSEPELAERMGVSRCSLREALKSLQNGGFISRTQRGGSYVLSENGRELGANLAAQARLAGLDDLLELREAIETKAVQCVIDRAEDGEIAALRALLSGGPDRPEGADRFFHLRLAELSRNSLLVAMLDMYYEMIASFARRSYQSEGKTRQMNSEHEQILAAIEKRDPRAAVAAVKTHLRNARRRVASEDENLEA